MTKPLFVAISDIHFNLANLELASESLRAALSKSDELRIPLVIAGDLHDTKAIIRGEVANRLIEIFKSATPHYGIYVLVGNHDLINEKGREHSLNFLTPYVTLVDSSGLMDIFEDRVVFFPYHTSNETLLESLKRVPKGSLLVMHQGFLGASMGDYVQDKSSISPEQVKDFTVISGHYHRHQTLGTVTYIGSPYTMTFGEANDGPKGFLVVNEDGSFERVILNLRKHLIVERTVATLEQPIPNYSPGDLVWVKVTGEDSKLKKIDKKELGNKLLGHSNFKLDLIPNESKELELITVEMTDEQIFDSIIEAEDDTEETKAHLKSLWRELI